MPEHHRRRGRKSPAQPPEPASARPGVVHHRHPDSSAYLHLSRRGQQPPQGTVVHVAVDSDHLAVGLELTQYRQLREVAGVDDQIGRPQPVDARAG